MGAEEEANAARDRGAARLAATLRRINDNASSSRTPGLRVPTLDADPPAGDPTTVWRFEDGRLRIRREDGGIDEFVPTANAAANLLSRASNSAADSAGLQIYRHSGSDELRVKRPDGTWAAYASTTGTSSGDGGGGSTGSGSSGTPKPSDPQTKQFTRTYSVTWWRAFCALHGVEDNRPYYGGPTIHAGSHGFTRLMLGFNDSQIRSDLDGARVREVSIKMRNTHSHANSGVVVHFGGHNRSTQPGAYSSVREQVFQDHWPKSGFGREWRDAPLWFGNRFRDNDIKGLTIRQPSSADHFYGAMDPGSFRLRIVYTKEV